VVSTFTQKEGQWMLSSTTPVESGDAATRQVIGFILDEDIENGLPDIGSGLRAEGPVSDSTHFIRTFDMGAGDDEIMLGFDGAASMIDLGAGNDIAEGGSRSDMIYGDSGNDEIRGGFDDDILFGGDGDDDIEGAGGNDVLMGMQGDDVLEDAHNRNIFQGGEGHDRLDAGGFDHDFTPEPNPEGDIPLPAQFGSLLDGGSGNDSVRDSVFADLVAGGRGDDDILLTGNDADVVVFNRGDEHDRILFESPNESNAQTLSLGGGIRHQDIELQKNGDDLVMHLGGGEFIVLAHWYEITEDNPAPISRLQIVAGAIESDDITQDNPVLEGAVQQYDFAAMVAAFDEARSNDPNLVRWGIVVVLEDAHIASYGNDTNPAIEALGGNLAYHYGLNGDFAGMSADSVWDILREEHFGFASQALSIDDDSIAYDNGAVRLRGSGSSEAPENSAPLDEEPIEDQIAAAGDLFEFTIPAGAFIDNDIKDYFLSYSATLADGSPLPAWLSFNPEIRTFSGTPGVGDGDVLQIKLTAADGGSLSAFTQFSINITQPGDFIGTNGDDFIEGTFGEDRIFGLDGDDILIGDDSNDYLAGGAGNDELEGNEGDDILEGGPGDDNLNGYEGNDILRSGPGNDELDGGEGNDVLEGGAGNTEYQYEMEDDDEIGHDIIHDIGGADVIDINVFSSPNLGFTAERIDNDLKLTFSPADSITVNDWFLSDDNKIEEIAYDNSDLGREYIFTPQDIDDLLAVGGHFVNQVIGTEDDDMLQGSADVDHMVGAGGNDQLHGQEGDDIIDGGEGDDFLYGGAGDDRIFSNSGADVVDGGAGHDILEGGENSTHYYYGVKGNGEGGDDIIFDIDGADTLHIKVESHDIDAGFIVEQAGFNGNDLKLTFAPGESLTIRQWFSAPTLSYPRRIENIIFEQADGTITEMTPDDIDAILAGGNQQPPVLDNPLADQSATEDAVFQFQVPAGTFSDPEGDDLALGATLADDSALPDRLSFDVQTGTFSGTPENGDVGGIDIKVTATDAAGESVSDTFTLTVNNTNDAPTVNGGIEDQIIEVSSVFEFTVPGATFTDIDAGDSLALSASLADGSVLPTWLTFDAATATFSGIPQPSDVIPLQIQVTATDDAGVSVSTGFRLGFAGETLTGTAGDDALTGGNGDDRLAGGLGNDTFTSGIGNDLLSGEEGNDLFYAGEGDDELSGGAGNDTLYGNAGNDRQFGGAGSDTLMGGAGADLLDGGEGSDYVYYSGSASAVQVDLGSGVVAGGDAEGDVLVNIEHAWGSGGDDSLTGDANANYLLGNSGHDTLSGGDGSDGLYGGEGDDRLFGGAGNDTLYANTGMDELDGGAGNDYLFGSSGGDTYLFGYGDDRDILGEDQTDTASTDTVLFADGIDIDDVWFSQSGDDLRVHLIGGDDRLQINDWFSDGHGIEQFQTANGDVLLESQVQQLVGAMAVFNPPDSGDLLVPQDIRDDVAATIAANWS
jgi:Ca2+-binding RTX toxin-like protein